MNQKSLIATIITVIAVALMAVTATGKELSLSKMTFEPMDLDARTGKGVRLDKNGKRCALLKVELPTPAAVFEGNVNGKVEYRGNTHRVYVASGTRKLRIMLDGYQPLLVDLSRVSSASGVESGGVYHIVVSGYEEDSSKPGNQSTTPEAGNLVIEFDGKTVGTVNNVTFDGDGNILSLSFRLNEENTSSDGKVIPYEVNGVKFNMVCVEGGTFQMGSDSLESEAEIDEDPRHLVTVKNFQVGQTEVTQGLWKAVMGSNPSNFNNGDSYPVETVSWEDCQTFLRKLNELTGKKFRLPTEAEWEFVARGGENGKGYKYSGSNNIGDVAWYDDNSSETTHAVGIKKANELGIYDMSGNVWEWCQDWKGDYPNHEHSTGYGRVVRGGSWHNASESCRVAFRGNCSPSGRDCYLGLRLAL